MPKLLFSRGGSQLLKLLADELQDGNRLLAALVPNHRTASRVSILHDTLDTQFVQPLLERDTALRVMDNQSEKRLDGARAEASFVASAESASVNVKHRRGRCPSG